MTMNYYLELLRKYPDVSIDCNKYTNLLHGFVTLVRPNKDKVVYYLHANGRVTKQDFTKDSMTTHLIEEFKEDDFEISNVMHQIKTYYLEFPEVNTKRELEYILNEFWKNTNYANLLHSGKWESVEFSKDTKISAKMMPIPLLCKTNATRRFYGIKSLPFDRTKDEVKNLYLGFVGNVYRNDMDTLLKSIEESIEEIKSVLDSMDVSYVFHECKHNRTIFV